MQSVKLWRNPTLWGVGALVLLAVLTLVAALLYIKPPGQNVIDFYTDDAASIRAGAGETLNPRARTIVCGRVVAAAPSRPIAAAPA